MSLFGLYTDHAARVIVFSAGQAQRMGAHQIDTAHTLVALVLDAATPWPGDGPSETPQRSLPLVESTSLAMRILGELGITGDSVIAEACRVAGFREPLSLAHPLSVEDCTTLPLSRGIRSAVNLEMAFARSRGDNHLSTLHQLVGAFSARRDPAREILMNLDISTVQTLQDTASVFEEDSREMNRRMHQLATTDSSLQRDIAALMTGTTVDSWRVRRKIRKTWPPGVPDNHQ